MTGGLAWATDDLTAGVVGGDERSTFPTTPPIADVPYASAMW